MKRTLFLLLLLALTLGVGAVSAQDTPAQNTLTFNPVSFTFGLPIAAANWEDIVGHGFVQRSGVLIPVTYAGIAPGAVGTAIQSLKGKQASIALGVLITDIHIR